MKFNSHERSSIFLILVVLIAFTTCNTKKIRPQFELLGKEQTNLVFENNPVQKTEFNVFNYMYFFNGAGVGAGDFNNDGLVDLFFTNNMGPNKLFLNKSNLKFEDVTATANIEGTDGWDTGVSVVDINNDGLLDVYVSQLGDYKVLSGKNQLYVCDKIENGIPVFKEAAAEYGLDLMGFSTQAAFFDYDLDGDLDMYQLNHSVHENGTFGQRKSFVNTYHPTSGDKLFQNRDGKFVEVTKESGINSTVIGYGLGIATGDVNLDGWPDIYIGNDFHENDYLYINQKDGTFKESISDFAMHTSRFSMGVDIADINNDAFSEVISLDMQPYDPFILKSSLGEDDYDIFTFKLKYGYNYQFARNNLQLNNGDSTFSEIGMYSKIHATDWSWAPLFVDFNNDGYKDLFVSNGIPRRMNDIDYMNYRVSDEDHRWRTNADYVDTSDMEIINNIPQIKLPNRFFMNSGKLVFDDISDAVSKNRTSYSNGAIYADFDNDGDLDVVTNNIDDEPYLYKNLATENTEIANDYLKLKLNGSENNINAIGSRVIVTKDNDEVLYLENYPAKGFQSSALAEMHIGIGDSSSVNHIYVVWPDGSFQEFVPEVYNKEYALSWKSGLPTFEFSTLYKKTQSEINFTDITEDTELDFKHKENPFVEFNRERLIPWMVSTEGPAVAVGDVNSDGLEDVFFGSSKKGLSSLYLQTAEGKFRKQLLPLAEEDAMYEDVDALFKDIDNDSDLDLVIATGGNEFWGESEYLLQRIYLNDGEGNFDQKLFLPDAMITASCVLASDFNKDGWVDLFFGARAEPYNYGVIPKSYFFLNNGDGSFKDATEDWSSEMRNVGMVKDGQLIDMDQDGDEDLVLALEWGKITVFYTDEDKFVHSEIGDNGLWNFVYARDFDDDGDVDIIAGNVGENSRFEVSQEQPLSLYVNDFDDNEQKEQVLTYYLGDREIPYATHKNLIMQMPEMKKKFLYAKDFARASITDLLGSDKVQESGKLEAHTLSSTYFEHDSESNTYIAHELPTELQLSSMETAISVDENSHLNKVIMAGNFYECSVEMGRYDASYGSLLSVGKDQLLVDKIGALRLHGQVRNLNYIKVDGKPCIIVARNNDSAQIIRIEEVIP